jgi:uncharacterized membrane protein YagU involved in acid resistance
MSRFPQGLIAGLVFGLVAVGLMLPLRFDEKWRALAAAFASRFAIGLAIACVQLPWPGSLVGFVFGLLLSVPDALITKAYAPILIVGAVGGTIIGGVVHGWR